MAAGDPELERAGSAMSRSYPVMHCVVPVGQVVPACDATVSAAAAASSQQDAAPRRAGRQRSARARRPPRLPGTTVLAPAAPCVPSDAVTGDGNLCQAPVQLAQVLHRVFQRLVCMRLPEPHYLLEFLHQPSQPAVYPASSVYPGLLYVTEAPVPRVEGFDGFYRFMPGGSSSSSSKPIRCGQLAGRTLSVLCQHTVVSHATSQRWQRCRVTRLTLRGMIVGADGKCRVRTLFHYYLSDSAQQPPGLQAALRQHKTLFGMPIRNSSRAARRAAAVSTAVSRTAAAVSNAVSRATSAATVVSAAVARATAVAATGDVLPTPSSLFHAPRANASDDCGDDSSDAIGAADDDNDAVCGTHVDDASGSREAAAVAVPSVQSVWLGAPGTASVASVNADPVVDYLRSLPEPPEL